MGDYLDSKAVATNYSNEAGSARMNATLAKRQAYAEAYKLESDSAGALQIAGDNMLTMRRNQSAAVAAQRVTNAASGFSAGSGSQLQQEASVAEVLELAVANAAKSAMISDVNAREQADFLRREGDTQYNLGMVQANYLQKMGKINREAGRSQLLGSVLYTMGAQGLKYNF